MSEDEWWVQLLKIFIGLAFGTVVCVLLWHIHHDLSIIINLAK